jgi:hypothetical protein
VDVSLVLIERPYRAAHKTPRGYNVSFERYGQPELIEAIEHGNVAEPRFVVREIGGKRRIVSPTNPSPCHRPFGT